MIVALESGALTDTDVPRMKYPGAHRTGIALLGQLIEASYRWDAATPPQRALLALHCTPTAAAARAGEVVHPPAVPDGMTTRTRDSLTTKGLVDGDRFTVWAVLAVEHGARRAAELVAS